MDFHVLDQAMDLKTVNVVFHYPVPATNNAVDISYRTALINYLGGVNAIVSSVPDITEVELAAMKAGEVYEVQTNVRWSRLGLTNGQKQAEVQAAYNNTQAEINGYFVVALAFYGYKGDVA